MTFTLTTHYSMKKPDVGSESGIWGGDVNTNLDTIDSTMFTNQSNIALALPLAGGTMTGVIKTKGEAETVNVKGNISGAVSFDLSLGQFITCTVTGAVTSVTFTNIPTTGFAVPIILKITNGQSSGAWTWGAAYKWPSATQPVMSSAGVDILSLVTHDAGTTYYEQGFVKALS